MAFNALVERTSYASATRAKMTAASGLSSLSGWYFKESLRYLWGAQEIDAGSLQVSDLAILASQRVAARLDRGRDGEGEDTGTHALFMSMSVAERLRPSSS